MKNGENEKKPTSVLKEEHEDIRKMLKILGKVCDNLKNGKEVRKENLNSIVEFIRFFADKCHHGKEENKLFPVMEEYGVPRDGGPIGVMLYEHEIGRGYVKNMASALEKEDWKSFVENATNYILLLDPHIDKENNILYMIADMHIPEEKQKELLEDFEKFEKEEIGEEKHKEFKKILNNLESIYIK